MPGCATHYLFGMEVYHSTDNIHIKDLIKKNASSFRLGLQGPDLFFYHLPYLKYDDYRNIGSYMHEHRVHQFFKEAFSLIPAISDSAKQEVYLAYLSGFLCHYVLDYMGHPFVYARTNYSTSRKDPAVFGAHTALELEIDRYYLNVKKGIPLSEFTPAIGFTLSGRETIIISNCLSHCMKRTFGSLYVDRRFPITPKMIRLIIKEARIENILLMDRKNRKSELTAKIEDRFFHNRLLTYKFITDKPIPIHDCLNMNHELWINPWNFNLSSSDSFDDLYKRALKECMKLFKLIYPDALFTTRGAKEKLPLILRTLGDYSYHSGIRITF